MFSDHIVVFAKLRLITDYCNQLYGRKQDKFLSFFLTTYNRPISQNTSNLHYQKLSANSQEILSATDDNSNYDSAITTDLHLANCFVN